jgi:hypothetical protein
VSYVTRVKTMCEMNSLPSELIAICKNLENQCSDHCDNGKEYLNHVVKDWWRSKGIDFQPTAPYNPQSNGSAERLNGVLWQKSTAMLVAANLGQKFWELAVLCANYVRNRSPHSSTPDNQPPYALFWLAKLSLAHLTIFGCACYPILNVEHRQKFKSSVITGLFVGYEAHSSFYRIYFLDAGKVKSYRDVVFNEQPLLNSKKRRHTLLHEEVLNWSDDEDNMEEDAEEPAGGGPAGGGPAGHAVPA